MTSATQKTENDGAIFSMMVTVLVAGAAMVAVAGWVSGARAATGVAVGAGIALLNLAVLAFTVRAFMGGDARQLPWAFLAVFKIALLFGGIYLLVQSGLVDLMPLALGYGALPMGIFVSQLKPSQTAQEGG